MEQPEAAESKELDFSVDEFRGRVSRAQQLMQKQGLGALLTTHLHNIYYFTGYRSWLRDSQHRPFAAVVPANGEPILILPSLEAGNANLKSWVSDVRLWQATDDYVGIYVDALRQVGALRESIGIEMGDDMWMGLPLYQWDRLRERASGTRFVSSSGLMWQLRSVKSLAEVAYLRKAAWITDQSVSAAWDALRPGVTELEIAATIGSKMLSCGAEGISFLIVKSGFGAHNAGNKYATSRAIQPGDIVTLDIGCACHGYSSDMIRSACIGQPNPGHRWAHEMAYALHRACISEVRPNVSIRQIDQARVRFLKQQRLPVPLYAGVGHNIGISVHEMPRIGPEGDGCLEAGNVITIEPSMKAGPWGGISVEDMVLVTESGYEYLTNAPRELFIK